MTDIPIECPGCHQEMWRPDKAVKLEATGPVQQSWSVCRHCSCIWRLDGRWRSATVEEATDPQFMVLLMMATKFAQIRMTEAANPGWLAQEEARYEAANQAETKH